MRASRVVALALIVGTFFVAQEVLTDLAAGKSVRVASDLVVVLLFWAVWAFLTPVVLMALRRWPLDARPAYRPLILHTIVAAILAAVHYMITLSLRSFALYLSSPLGARDALRRNASPIAFVWAVFTGIFFYSVVAMVYTALRFRAELTQAKLDTLRSQLRPHFLFNTLNAISVFVTEDAAKAQQMILRLSTLLRRSLDEEAHEVPLQQELGFVNDYLDIQRGRFGDQLSVRLRVDPAVLDARVPVFLFQPLLENAVEHGRGDGKGTTIALSASRDDDMLRLVLDDNGPGVRNGAAAREGIGLRNTRARLHHLYGSRGTVHLGPAQADTESPGVRVEILIPYRETAG
jgi:two-component system LytT family sensor kinase